MLTLHVSVEVCAPLVSNVTELALVGAGFGVDCREMADKNFALEEAFAALAAEVALDVHVALGHVPCQHRPLLVRLLAEVALKGAFGGVLIDVVCIQTLLHRVTLVAQVAFEGALASVTSHVAEQRTFRRQSHAAHFTCRRRVAVHLRLVTLERAGTVEDLIAVLASEVLLAASGTDGLVLLLDVLRHVRLAVLAEPLGFDERQRVEGGVVRRHQVLLVHDAVEEEDEALGTLNDGLVVFFIIILLFLDITVIHRLRPTLTLLCRTS